MKKNSYKFLFSRKEKTNTQKIEKLKQSIKNAGDSVYALGWLNVVASIGVIIYSVASKDFRVLVFSTIIIWGVLLALVFGVVFVKLGNRIRKVRDKKMGLYIKVLIPITILYGILSIICGGLFGLLVILVFFYLLSSLRAVIKLMKMEEFTSTLN